MLQQLNSNPTPHQHSASTYGSFEAKTNGNHLNNSFSYASFKLKLSIILLKLNQYRFDELIMLEMLSLANRAIFLIDFHYTLDTFFCNFCNGVKSKKLSKEVSKIGLLRKCQKSSRAFGGIN